MGANNEPNLTASWSYSWTTTMAVSSRRLVEKHRPCYQPLAHAEITKPILFARRNPTTARPLGMITHTRPARSTRSGSQLTPAPITADRPVRPTPDPHGCAAAGPPSSPPLVATHHPVRPVTPATHPHLV